MNLSIARIYLEAKYPFADNIYPETALAGILWRDRRG
jgi:hypothetical protein